MFVVKWLKIGESVLGKNTVGVTSSEWSDSWNRARAPETPPALKLFHKHKLSHTQTQWTHQSFQKKFHFDGNSFILLSIFSLFFFKACSGGGADM